MTAVVPVNDLSRALIEESVALRAAFEELLESGWLIHGPQHAAFEQELADYLGCGSVHGVASGTDALEIALRAVCTSGRRTVVTVANAGGYTAVAALAAGCTVRWCDIREDDLLIDPVALEQQLDDTVAAVVVTHLYGQMAEVASVRRLCEPRGIAVIEDCAQCIGARGPQGAAGALGDLAAFSFYPTKNLGALGDGGAVVCNDSALTVAVRELRQYGWTGKYVIERLGGRNSRLDEFQAAVLRRRLPLLDAGNARRREIVTTYSAAASDRIRVLPAQTPDRVGHLAVVVTPDAADLARHLGAIGVRSEVHYPVPDHRQPAFADMAKSVSLPVTEKMVGKHLSLPCFPALTSEEVDQVCRGLASY